MGGQAQRVVQLWQAYEQDDGPVTGIHLEIEQDLQVVQDGITDIVSLINDNDGRPLFLKCQPVDLRLYGMEVFRFPVSRLCAEGRGEAAVEVIDSQCREAGVNRLEQGRVQLPYPFPDSGGFAPARGAGKHPEALSPGEVIQPEQSFPEFCSLVKDLFGIF